MAKKTPLMEQYERENPKKHAIWNGELTEQFRIWREKKLDPSYNSRFLYEGEDGFKIERKSGDTNYYSKILNTIVKRYGLSENPDWNRVEHIGQLIYDYMNRSRFKLGYPIMCEINFHSDLVDIARSISMISKQNLSSDESYSEFCREIIK